MRRFACRERSSLRSGLTPVDASSIVLHEGSAPFDVGLDAEQLSGAFPEACFVVRGGRIELVTDRLSSSSGTTPAGGEVNETIPDWREGVDASVPFEAWLLPRRCRAPGGAAAARSGDGEAVVAVRDARELLAGREAEIALAEAEARYRGLVEQIPAVVYADDGDVRHLREPADRAASSA